MKTLEDYTTDEILEERIYEICREFDGLHYKTAKQLLLNILAEPEFGRRLIRRAKEYMEEPSRWEVEAVEPTSDPDQVLVTLKCPECEMEYWFKVRRHFPDELITKAYRICPSCGKEIRAPKKMIF